MKRIICMILALSMIFGMFACTKSDQSEQTAAATEKPAGAQTQTQTQNASTPTDAPKPTEMPLNWYSFLDGGAMKIGFPLDFPDPVILKDGSLRFRDPDKKWTMIISAVTARQITLEVGNYTNRVEGFRSFGYYQDIVVEDREIGGYFARYLAFSRNPDWESKSMGYTASYTEPHAFYVVDFQDRLIGGAGGIIIDISAPEDTVADLNEILSDEALEVILSNIVFEKGVTGAETSVPGIKASFPVRWTIGNNGSDTVWGSGTEGDQPVSVYVKSSIYADPNEAASYITKDYRSVEGGGRTWVGDVRTATLSGSNIYTLELYTAFSQHHAAQLKISLSKAESAEELWAFTETETFRKILDNIVLEPASFHEPEADRMDASGFEANNINEIKAYTGTSSEIVIPSVVGTTEILGINYGVFKGNENLTKVELSEGITYIESLAFKDCVNLKTVILPDSLIYIDSEAFVGCKSLETVQFGNGLVYIGNYAFRDCTSLGNVTLPETVKTVGSCAFYGAGNGTGQFKCLAEGTAYGAAALSETKFKFISFGPDADLSEPNILANASVEMVTIGDGTEKLGNYFLISYAGDKLLREVNIPDSLKIIGNSAFERRSGMKSFNFKNVEAIGDYAFCEVGFREITIPGTCKAVGASAFVMCPNLEKIVFEEGVETIGDYAFSSAGRKDSAKMKSSYFYTLTPEYYEKYKSKLYNPQDPEVDTALSVYLPSTIQHVGSCVFSGSFINGIYMTWCTDASVIGKIFSQDTFSGNKYFLQTYFSEETINAIGDQLDSELMKLEDCEDNAWYDVGIRIYFSSVKNLEN